MEELKENKDKEKDICFEVIKKISMIKFGYDPTKIFKKSKLLENIKTQTTLGRWF